MSANGELAGRVALVSGAGGGVGQGIALAFAAAGASVVVAARRASTGNETARLISAEGGKAVCIESDVRDRNQVDVAIASALREYGTLDIVGAQRGQRQCGRGDRD